MPTGVPVGEPERRVRSPAIDGQPEAGEPTCHPAGDRRVTLASYSEQAEVSGPGDRLDSVLAAELA